ncbi:14184_t:CDS:1, partial [Ambispora leptoticha]
MHIGNVFDVDSENNSASISRIFDVEFAKVSAEFVSRHYNQILGLIITSQ